MQVVAVTDPLELGFARQAMIGIRASGRARAGRRRGRRARRGRLRRDHRRLLRPARRGGLRERRGTCSRCSPTKIRTIENVVVHRDVHVPPAAQADLLVGRALSRRRRAWARLSLWHETAGDDWTPRPVAARRHRRRRRVVGAGLHRALDRLLPAAEADPTLRIVVLEAETAGFGASGPQRRLVLGAVPRLPGHAGRRCPARPRPRPWPSTGRCAPPSTRCSRVAGRRGHRRPGRTRAAPSRWPAPPPQWRRARDEVADGPRLGPRRGRRTAARRRPRRAARLAPPAPSAATYTPDCAALHPARLVRGLARGGRAARRPDPRADPGHARSSPAGRVTDARHGARRGRGARHRGLHPRRSPAMRARRGAGLLPGRRHRAAARRRPGSGSGCASARRSPTTAT